MAKVYISCTSSDLQECRHKISQLLRRIGYDDVSLPFYLPESERPLPECLAEIARCDLYIVILAWRYGWIPARNNSAKISFIEIEYQTAVEHGKPCLVFLLHGKALWPPDFIDDNKQTIRELRERLNEKHNPLFFTSSEDITTIVASALISWGKRRGDSIPNSLSNEVDTPQPESKTQRYKRLSTLFEHFPDDPDSLPLLRQRAVEDDEDWVRHDAIAALAEYYREESETLSLLCHCAIHDPSDWVRRGAISLLADHFTSAPQTVELLCQRVTEDPQKDVRSAIVYILVRYFRNAPQTLSLLCDRAVEDPDEWVRRNAVCALAENFHGARESFAIIHDRATNDSRKDVRAAAVYALVRYFRDNTETFEALCDRAVNDKSPRAESRRVPFSYVREIAINALARFWPTHPQTIALLQDRIRNDQTPWLRETAKKLMREIGGQN